MSDPAVMREWRFYIDDMIGFCERVQQFTSGLDQSGFIADPLRFDATVRNVELIGEAATHIPDHVRHASPAIPWRVLIATRNRLIHGYLGVDNDILWNIVETDVPLLLTNLQRLKSDGA